MANLTYYSANRVNDLILGRTAITTPSTFYLGISTTPIQNDGTGATEPTADTAYARVAIANNKTNFSTSVSGTINNLVEFGFSESTINQGVITHWLFSDALVGGNIWFQGALTLPRTVESATVLVLPIGSFSNTVD